MFDGLSVFTQQPHSNEEELAILSPSIECANPGVSTSLCLLSPFSLQPGEILATPLEDLAAVLGPLPGETSPNM